MAYYKICQDCGANLDPDEVCDCKKERWYVEGKLICGNAFSSEINGKPYIILKRLKSKLNQ